MIELLQHVRFEGRGPALTGTRMSRSADVAHRAQPSRRVSRKVLSPDERLLVEAIFAEADLRIEDFRSAPLCRRIPAVLRALRCSNLKAARRTVEASQVGAPRALHALLIGHTLPFRDPPVFETLRDVVLPRLDRGVRVWSIGCSRGMELLSVALLLEEQGLEVAELRGSDCRQIDAPGDRTLTRDLRASIPSAFGELRRKVTPQWVGRQVQRINWRREDVCRIRDEGNWDLILCRNLLIYLEPDSACQLWRMIASALRPGGYLLTGKAERPLGVAKLARVASCTYQAAGAAS